MLAKQLVRWIDRKLTTHWQAVVKRMLRWRYGSRSINTTSLLRASRTCPPLTTVVSPV